MLTLLVGHGWYDDVFIHNMVLGENSARTASRER